MKSFPTKRRHTTLSILCLPNCRSSPPTTPPYPSNKVHLSITSFTSLVSRSYPKPIFSEQRTHSSSPDNHYINDNLLFGDLIIDNSSSSSRTIFTNVNGVKPSSYSATLENLCNYMYLNNVDVACMSEIHSH